MKIVAVDPTMVAQVVTRDVAGAVFTTEYENSPVFFKVYSENPQAEVYIKRDIFFTHFFPNPYLLKVEDVIYDTQEKVWGERYETPIFGNVYKFVTQHLFSLDHDAKFEAIWQITHDIAQGLEIVHGDGFVHSNVCLNSVYVSANHGLYSGKLSGFCFTFPLNGEPDTQEIKARGYHFAAPEMLYDKHCGEAIDAWSLGAVMYYMVTGTLPFSGSNYQTVAHKMIYNPVTLPPGTPIAIITVINELLETDPTRRLTVSEFAAIAGQHCYSKIISSELK